MLGILKSIVKIQLNGVSILEFSIKFNINVNLKKYILYRFKILYLGIRSHFLLQIMFSQK